MRFDGLLDLVKGKAEFTPKTRSSPRLRVGSPRGNIAPDLDQFLCQERDKQFPIKPSAGTAVVPHGYVPQLGEALQSLEHQFNLPTPRKTTRHSPNCPTLDRVRNRERREMRLPYAEYATKL